MSTTGYSATPLSRKLGIKPGARVALLSAPDGLGDLLAALPSDAKVTARARGPLDVIVQFTSRRSHLERRLPILLAALEPRGGLWVAWPKRASGLATDLTEDRVRELGLAMGVVDNKVCAIDETWSALRFVYRLADRPAG